MKAKIKATVSEKEYTLDEYLKEFDPDNQEPERGGNNLEEVLRKEYAKVIDTEFRTRFCDHDD